MCKWVVCVCVCHRLINLINSKIGHNSIKWFIWKRFGKSINFVDEPKHNLFTLIFFFPPPNEFCSQHRNTLNNPNVWIWQSTSLAVAMLPLIVSFKLFFIPFFFLTVITISPAKINFWIRITCFSLPIGYHRLKHLNSLCCGVARQKQQNKIWTKLTPTQE